MSDLYECFQTNQPAENSVLNMQQQASLIAGRGLDNRAVQQDMMIVRDRNMDTLQANYANFRDELIQLDTHGNMVDKIVRYREKQLDNADKDLYNIRNNIMTLRRQTEISENSFMRKDDIINILRTTFLFLTLAVLSVMFIQNTGFFNLVIIVLVLSYAVYLWYMYQHFRARDPNRWTVQRWEKPSMITNYEAKPIDDSCGADSRENASRLRTKMDIEKQLTELQRQINTYDTTDKSINSRIDAIQQKIKDLRSANGLQQAVSATKIPSV